jgi:hypothetical protein
MANIAAPLAAAYGVATFILVALFGFTKDPSVRMWDFAWYYAGGECFRDGSNMYDLSCFQASLKQINGFDPIAGLAYPPHFAIVTRLIASPTYNISAQIFLAATITAAVSMVALINLMEKERHSEFTKDAPLSHLWAIFLVLGNSGMWGAIWLGQITVFVALCAWCAFRCLEKKNDALAGFLLALLSLKPQLAILVFIWVLLQGRITALLWATLFAGLMSIYIFAQMGILPALEGWLTGLSSYQSYDVNRLGNSSIMGVPSFLALLGIDVSVATATAFATLALIAFRVHKPLNPFSPMILSTILLLQMLVFSRPVDTCLIAPAFALIWPTKRSNSTASLLFLIAVAVFCIPQRPIAEMVPWAVAAHFRTFLLIALAGVFVTKAWREPAGTVSPSLREA